MPLVAVGWVMLKTSAIGLGFVYTLKAVNVLFLK